ncbi:MAG: hypothetical protein HRU15_01265 [Planctomycetes bacterium]|nr:hypothetical protein [Planctomycetota bacterium]
MQTIHIMTQTICTLLLLQISVLVYAVDSGANYPDIIFLANGQRMQVLLDKLPEEDSETVILKTPGDGLITLDLSLIAEIRPGLEYRLKNYDRENIQEMIELSRFCLAAGRKEEALKILSAAHEKQALPTSHLRTLAQLTDQFIGPEKALVLYKKYRELGGKDASTLIRLEVLEDAISQHKAQIEKIFKENPQSKEITEGLEKSGKWRSENIKWANAVTVTQHGIDMGENRTNTVLQAEYLGGDNYKAAAVLQTTIDLREQNQCNFYISNPSDKAIRISIAVKCGSRWNYFESRTKSVPAQAVWEVMTFDLTRKDFKSQATNWAHKSSIDELHAVREIQILIHNEKEDGMLMIDGIGFSKPQKDF